MILTLGAQHLCIIGTMQVFGSQDALRRALVAGGAQVSARLTRQTTAVIAGIAPGELPHHARARGLPVLTEWQAKQLIQHGVLELADPAPPAALARDAAISALRPHLTAPSSANWSAVLAALDRCPAEQLGELVDYVEGHVGRWEAAPHDRWAARYAEDDTTVNEWARYLPLGELRCAPVRWLAGMWQGEPSAKHRVVRGVSARGLGATPTQVMALLKLPTLEALTHLDLGETASAALWRALLTGEAAGRIKRLTVTALHGDQASGFEVTPAPQSALEQLEIAYQFTETSPDAMLRLLRAPLAAKLKALTLSGDDPLHALTQLRGLTEHIYDTICLDMSQRSGALRTAGQLAAPCRALRVVWPLRDNFAQHWRALGSLRPLGPDTLDVSGVTVAPDKREEASAGLLGMAQALAVGGASAPSVRLGGWWSEAVAATFAHYGVAALP